MFKHQFYEMVTKQTLNRCVKLVLLTYCDNRKIGLTILKGFLVIVTRRQIHVGN